MIEALAGSFHLRYTKRTPTGSDFANTPFDEQHDQACDLKTYQRLIGSLQYLALMTRPDISCLVSFLGRRSARPAERHMGYAKRIVAYLVHTVKVGHIISTGENLNIWVDASYGGEEGRSQLGVVACLGDTAIGWSSRRQDIVALSTIEAEYIAMAEGAKDCLWLYCPLKEFCLLFDSTPPVLLTDNDGASRLARSQTFHRRTKHIDIRYHFIRDLLHRRELVLHWLSGELKKADMLTKMLTGLKAAQALESILGTQPPSTHALTNNQPTPLPRNLSPIRTRERKSSVSSQTMRTFFPELTSKWHTPGLSSVKSSIPTSTLCKTRTPSSSAEPLSASTTTSTTPQALLVSTGSLPRLRILPASMAPTTKSCENLRPWQTPTPPCLA